MKTLLAGLSVLALTAGSAYADPSNPGGGVVTPTADPLMAAWESHAPTPEKTNPVGPGFAGPVIVTPKNGITTIDVEIRKEKDGSEIGSTGQTKFSYIDQVGLTNAVDVDQTNAGIGAISDVIQIGDHNDARVVQETEGASTTGDYAVITQQGDKNDAFIEQNNRFPDGEPANMADIQQGSSTGDANNNLAGISQTGRGNMAEVDQLDGAVFNQAAIDQFGGSNQAEAEQAGGYNVADINQRTLAPPTLDNKAGINQDGWDNLGRIDQDGLANEAQTIQTGNDNYSYTSQIGDDNLADVIQNGNDNMSDVYQAGTGNGVWVAQDGDWNMSWIDQDGTDNQATVAQNTNENWSAIEQGGIGNLAMVTQAGFAASDIQQFGGSNSALVNQ